jgi:hypothetical protein
MHGWHQQNMKWTSTRIRQWEIDCDSFRKVGRSFELRNVTTPEHEQFAAVFCARYEWICTKDGTTLLFSPQI